MDHEQSGKILSLNRARASSDGLPPVLGVLIEAVSQSVKALNVLAADVSAELGAVRAEVENPRRRVEALERGARQ